MSLESCPYIFPEDTVSCLSRDGWQLRVTMVIITSLRLRNSQDLDAFHLFMCEGRVVY